MNADNSAIQPDPVNQTTEAHDSPNPEWNSFLNSLDTHVQQGAWDDDESTDDEQTVIEARMAQEREQREERSNVLIEAIYSSPGFKEAQDAVSPTRHRDYSATAIPSPGIQQPKSPRWQEEWGNIRTSAKNPCQLKSTSPVNDPVESYSAGAVVGSSPVADSTPIEEPPPLPRVAYMNRAYGQSQSDDMSVYSTDRDQLEEMIMNEIGIESGEAIEPPSQSAMCRVMQRLGMKLGLDATAMKKLFGVVKSHSYTAVISSPAIKSPRFLEEPKDWQKTYEIRRSQLDSREEFAEDVAELLH